MATNGSACLWLKTGAGRQFSKITAVDDGLDTVTVEDAFNIAAGSPVDYAIGGKRATLDNADSRTLFGATGAKAGWIIEVQTDQSLTTPITLTAAGSAAAGAITLRGAPSSGETAKVTQTINDECFDGALNRWRLERLQLVNSNATKTAANGVRVTAASGTHTLYRCVFGDATDRLNTGYSQSVNSAIALIEDCEFKECVSDGIGLAAGGAMIRDCYIHDCDSEGIAIAISGDYVTIVGTIVSRCGSANGGIVVTDEVNLVLVNCTLDDNNGSGLYFSSATVFGQNIILGNNFTNNGTGGAGYGIDVVTPADVADLKKVVCDYNNFFGNFTAPRENIAAGDNDTALDPAYPDADNGDYRVGQTMRAAGFPDSGRTIGANQSDTTSFVDIGAAQRDETLGGVILGARRRIR